ncbi:hypothetical protein A3709_19105 [Halioglobus sp. HI00S01]|uniref:OmpA family protein n=1 Tax=Halioglobus sp. HI00S01 TaxID=1822214 RepID=UPI0007C3E2EB|nr:OmpA family protein [Halioglobus sp. HI00S01]KZX57734.1 hypothetical protein A3709_19105 [Halioglobus sp. HI00S01]
MRNIYSRLPAILLSLLVAGCTANPYTDDKQVAKTAKYGGIAATVCGLAGAIDSSETALISAAACGLVAAGYGAYVDAQEAELRATLRGTGVRVSRDGDRITLVMPGHVVFDFDSKELDPSFYRTLSSVSLVLAEFDETRVSVVGHTDNVGGRDYNFDLSVERAVSVAVYLVTQGVDESRLDVIGAAFDRPIASNATAVGRAKNRRVEISIIPMSG